MNYIEFKKFIESIGFKYNSHNIFYEYKIFKIDLFFIDHYEFWSGSKWINYNYNDLTPFKVFKKELRSIKLKNILG